MKKKKKEKEKGSQNHRLSLLIGVVVVGMKGFDVHVGSGGYAAAVVVFAAAAAAGVVVVVVVMMVVVVVDGHAGFSNYPPHRLWALSPGCWVGTASSSSVVYHP